MQHLVLREELRALSYHARSCREPSPRRGTSRIALWGLLTGFSIGLVIVKMGLRQSKVTDDEDAK